MVHEVPRLRLPDYAIPDGSKGSRLLDRLGHTSRWNLKMPCDMQLVAVVGCGVSYIDPNK